jgi:hypothetical protein
MSLDVRLLVQLTASLTGSSGLISVSAPLSLPRQINLSDGSGLGQASKAWSARRTISSSATDSLDLAGSLTDPLGAALTFTKLKLVIVAAALSNTVPVALTRPSSNGVPLFSAAGDALPVHPGGVVVWAAPTAAGVAVTAGTGDLLDLVNGAASSTVDVALIGA